MCVGAYGVNVKGMLRTSHPPDGSGDDIAHISVGNVGTSDGIHDRSPGAIYPVYTTQITVPHTLKFGLKMLSCWGFCRVSLSDIHSCIWYNMFMSSLTVLITLVYYCVMMMCIIIVNLIVGKMHRIENPLVRYTNRWPMGSRRSHTHDDESDRSSDSSRSHSSAAEDTDDDVTIIWKDAEQEPDGPPAADDPEELHDKDDQHNDTRSLHEDDQHNDTRSLHKDVQHNDARPDIYIGGSSTTDGRRAESPYVSNQATYNAGLTRADSGVADDRSDTRRGLLRRKTRTLFHRGAQSIRRVQYFWVPRAARTNVYFTALCICVFAYVMQLSDIYICFCTICVLGMVSAFENMYIRFRHNLDDDYVLTAGGSRRLFILYIDFVVLILTIPAILCTFTFGNIQSRLHLATTGSGLTVVHVIQACLTIALLGLKYNLYTRQDAHKVDSNGVVYDMLDGSAMAGLISIICLLCMRLGTCNQPYPVDSMLYNITNTDSGYVLVVYDHRVILGMLTIPFATLCMLVSCMHSLYTHSTVDLYVILGVLYIEVLRQQSGPDHSIDIGRALYACAIIVLVASKVALDMRWLHKVRQERKERNHPTMTSLEAH